MISIKGHRYPKAISQQTVRWYHACSLSMRNLEERLQERGSNANHSTINNWILKFPPILATCFS